MTGPQWQLARLDRPSGALHGLTTGSDESSMAIHFHGTWGNFYENAIATAFAPIYAHHGYAFSTVNLPGHDGESMTEKFEDSLDAISDWIAHLAQDRNVVIQAHSLGALKTMRFLESARAAAGRIQATVLLAPFDIRAFYAQSPDASIKIAKRDRALQRCELGEGDQVVSNELFSIWPITNATYAHALEEDGVLDVFPTSDGSAGLLSKLPISTFFALGGDDFSASPSPSAVVEIVTKRANPTVVTLIDGAPHNFAGFEGRLGEDLDGFLAQL
jgi:pimeloyl-ACP methyl ester carboxylesterase